MINLFFYFACGGEGGGLGLKKKTGCGYLDNDYICLFSSLINNGNSIGDFNITKFIKLLTLLTNTNHKPHLFP